MCRKRSTSARCALHLSETHSSKPLGVSDMVSQPEETFHFSQIAHMCQIRFVLHEFTPRTYWTSTRGARDRFRVSRCLQE